MWTTRNGNKTHEGENSEADHSTAKAVGTWIGYWIAGVILIIAVRLAYGVSTWILNWLNLL